MENKDKYHYDDFTEDRYRQYLRFAKQRWKFDFYSDSDVVVNHLLIYLFFWHIFFIEFNSLHSFF